MVDMNTIVESWLVRALELDNYMKTINNLDSIDITSDSNEALEYRTNYNYFYKIRRNEEWRKIYYDYFEKNKSNKDLSFKDIITYLYNKTGRVEASFSSKMLATINPNMPIWDQYVLKNTNIEIDNRLTKKAKLQESIDAYDKIIAWYNNHLPEYKDAIAIFNKLLPDYKISDIKKIDFILWTSRESSKD